jgi:hypothetical protein
MRPNQWRRTKIGKYLRHLPRAKHIRGTWLHRILGDKLFSPELWHPTRERFAAGMAIGAFFALVPLPLQMLGAAFFAYISRVNIPAAIAGTWISNPLTFPFCVYAQYRIGCLLIQREPIHFQSHDALSMLAKAPVPFFVGVVPAALLLAIVTYPLTLLLWDWTTKGIQHTRKKRESIPKA